MTGIQEKVVAITGASSGIGRATALFLAARGAKVVVGARRQTSLDSLVAEIAALGGEAVSVAIDVKKSGDLVRLIDAACTHYGKIDVLVSNAGVAPVSLLDELRVQDWEDMIDINTKGLLYGIAAALPIFRAQGFGHFINILSTATLRIVPTMSVYAASKHAAKAITEGLRQEAGANLRVTAISPGFVQTGLDSSMTNAEVAAATGKLMKEIGIPPEAIARCIAFAIEQPADVDVSEIVVRPTIQA